MLQLLLYIVFEDPILGPRVIPSSENILANKIKLSDNAVFHIDSKKGVVTVKVENNVSDVGESLLYCVGL